MMPSLSSLAVLLGRVIRQLLPPEEEEVAAAAAHDPRVLGVEMSCLAAAEEGEYRTEEEEEDPWRADVQTRSMVWSGQAPTIETRPD